jgi:thiol-disulfide isomerase/thioredoxin
MPGACIVNPLSAVLLCLMAAPAGAGADPVAGSDPAIVAAPAQEIGIGQPLREALLTGLNGPSRLLSTYRGKPLLINVWASWCGPCKAEMASLELLAWREQSRYFAIIGISTDDEAARAAGFLKLSNATISHFIDSRLQMEHMLGASRLPLTVLVDADGRVLAKIYGARQWDGPEALRLIDEAFRTNR